MARYHADAKNNLYVVATGEDYNDANSSFLYIFITTNLVFKNQIGIGKYAIPDNYGGSKFYESEPILPLAIQREQGICDCKSYKDWFSIRMVYTGI